MERDCGEGCEGRGGIVDHEKKGHLPSHCVSSTQAGKGRPPSEAKRGKRENKKEKEEEKQPSGLSSTSSTDLHARPLPPLPPPPKAERRNEHGCSFSRQKDPSSSFSTPPLAFSPSSSAVTIPRRRRRIGYQPLPLPSSSRFGCNSSFPDSLCRRRHRLSLPSLQRSPERDTTQRKEALSPPPFLPPPNSHSLLLPPSPYPSYSADERRPPEGRTDGKRPRKE